METTTTHPITTTEARAALARKPASWWTRDEWDAAFPVAARRHPAADHTLACLATGGGRTGCAC